MLDFIKEEEKRETKEHEYFPTPTYETTLHPKITEFKETYRNNYTVN